VHRADPDLPGEPDVGTSHLVPVRTPGWRGPHARGLQPGPGAGL